MVIYELGNHGFNSEEAADVVDNKYSAVVDNAIRALAEMNDIIRKLLDLLHHDPANCEFCKIHKRITKNA